MAVRAYLFAGVTLAAFVYAVGCSSDPGTQANGGGGGPGSGASGCGEPDFGFDGGALNVDDAGTVALGKQFVQQRDCYKCHGPDLSGLTTPLSGYPAGVKLYSPNLTPDPATGIGSWTDVQLAQAIHDGFDNTGARLCLQMKHYNTMQDCELSSIIAYLRSIPAVSKQVPGSVCPPLKNGP